MTNKCKVKECNNHTRSKNSKYCEKHYGRIRRNGSLKTKYKNYKYNKKAFIEMNFSQAWVLGLIWSDGYLKKNTIGIKSKDKSMLIKAEKAIAGKGLIVPTKCGKYYDLRFTDQYVANHLRTMGLTEGKSLSIEWPKNLKEKFYSHFIRGIFDGDGTVGFCRLADNSKRIHDITIVSGSEKFAKSLHEILTRLNFNPNIYIKKNKSKGIFAITISNIDGIEKFKNYIYKDDEKYFHLSRKKDKLSSQNYNKLKVGRKEGTTLSQESQQEIINIFKNEGNRTIKKTSEITGLAEETISRVIKLNNIKIIKSRSIVKRMTSNDINKIKFLRSRGMTFKEIEKNTGFKRNSIRHALKSE